MKCSELMVFLKQVIEEHGDLPVACVDHEYGGSHEAAFEVVASNIGTQSNKDCEDHADLGTLFLRAQ